MGCCSMILQCLSRRCERCTSGGSVSRANARSDAASHRTCCAWAMPPPPLPSSPPVAPSAHGTASRSSISLDLAAASCVSVSSSPQSSSSSISTSPASRVVSSSAPDTDVASAPSAPASPSREADRPDDVSGARDADAGSGDRDAGSLKGLSKRLATQQYPSHAPMSSPRRPLVGLVRWILCSEFVETGRRQETEAAET